MIARGALLTILLAASACAAEPLALPPGASHVRTSAEEITAYDVGLSPGQVDTFYRKTLAARGWQLGDSVNYGTTVVLDAHKGHNERGRVTIAPLGPGLTHVTLSLSQ